MQSLLQILKVNDERKGIGRESGREYHMQDCEVILLNDDGTPSQVGVLTLPSELIGKIGPGVYTGSFALAASLKDRRIGARLVNLVAVPPAPRKAA